MKFIFSYEWILNWIQIQIFGAFVLALISNPYSKHFSRYKATCVDSKKTKCTNIVYAYNFCNGYGDKVPTCAFNYNSHNSVYWAWQEHVTLRKSISDLLT